MSKLSADAAFKAFLTASAAVGTIFAVSTLVNNKASAEALAAVETRVAVLESRLDNIERKLDNIDAKVDTLLQR